MNTTTSRGLENGLYGLLTALIADAALIPTGQLDPKIAIVIDIAVAVASGIIGVLKVAYPGITTTKSVVPPVTTQ